MRSRIALLSCIIGAGLTAACQSESGPAGNAASEAPGNAANAQAAAPAPAAPDPADATGPVALASDASLPEPCQTVVRETQSCIDNLSGPQAGFRESWARSSLASSRQTWASAQDDTYRGPVCEQDLRTLRERAAEWECAAR